MSYASEQTHASSGGVAISKDRYNVMRVSAAGLGLALIIVLFLLFNQPKVAPPLPLPEEVWIDEPLGITVPADVVDKLKNVHRVNTVVYISDEGKIRVTGPDGTKRDICADFRGSEIVERPGKSCGLKGITPRHFLQILYFTYNPGCASAGGNLGC